MSKINQKSRHDDCFQLEWRAGGKHGVLNLSAEQVKDYLLNDLIIHNFVSDFVEQGMDVYEQNR